MSFCFQPCCFSSQARNRRPSRQSRVLAQTVMLMPHILPSPKAGLGIHAEISKLSTLGKTERWLKNPENLPAIPAMVQQAMALLESNSSSVSEVARVIQRDEAIVVKILKVINSAFFGLPRKVNTISEAIALLGFGQTRLLLISPQSADSPPVLHLVGDVG